MMKIGWVDTRRNRRRAAWVGWLWVPLGLLAAGAAEAQTALRDPGEEAVEHVRWALDRYPIVLMGEGSHGAAEPHQVLRRILSDKGVRKRLDVIVVEFATAAHQDVLDDFIRGDDVPFDSLSAVWRNTSTSPVAPWNSPIYRELLQTVREGNRGLPAGEMVRVVAGDPPLDWPSIQTAEDYRRASRPRDPYAAGVAMEQAFGLGKRVLVIYGGGHLPRLPLGPGDLRNPITSYILAEHPASAWVIEFMWPVQTGLADQVDELVEGRVYRTAEHWSGSSPAPLLFLGTRSLVSDPVTGEQSWQEVPLYEGLQVRDLYDALIYLGREGRWTVPPQDLDPERDAAYLAEVERRRSLRFGGRSPGA